MGNIISTNPNIDKNANITVSVSHKNNANISPKETIVASETSTIPIPDQVLILR